MSRTVPSYQAFGHHFAKSGDCHSSQLDRENSYPINCWVHMPSFNHGMQEDDLIYAIVASGSHSLIKCCHKYCHLHLTDFRSQGHKPASLLEQAALLIAERLKLLYPNLATKIASVEFWAHCREPGAPHQLHFDTDETRLGPGVAGNGINGQGPFPHPVRHALSVCQALLSSPLLRLNRVLLVLPQPISPLLYN